MDYKKEDFLGGRLRQSQLDQYIENDVERVEKVPGRPGIHIRRW